MCLKTAKFKEAIEQTKKKHPKYPLIYIFGKSKGNHKNDQKGIQENVKDSAKGKADKS
jgi:hypothetical protein